MLLTQLAAVLATGLVLGTSASPVQPSKRLVPATHALHERHIPQHAVHWSKRSRVPATALLPVRIGLAQGNIDAGHERLLAISDKTSEHYGKHMTAEEVIDFFAPPQTLVDAVTEWISSSGISKERIGHSTNKQWLQFDATAQELEDLLYAEFHVYQHADGSEDVSTEAYHVPAHIREHIDYITPGTRLRATKGSPSSSSSLEKRAGKPVRIGSGHVPPKALYLQKEAGSPQPFVINSTTCDVSVVADCLRHQYGITKLTGKAQPGNELGVFESLGDHYSKRDLDVYFSTLYPEIPNGTYPIEHLIDGAVGAVEEQPAGLNPPITAGGESMLDFSSAIPLIYPQKTVLFQTDDEWYERNQTDPNTKYFGFYNTFLDAIDGSYCTYDGGNCATADCLDPEYPNPNSPDGYKGGLQCGVYRPTNVVSVSYGSSGMPDKYVRRQCHELMKLGLQGTTVISSSGDDGVGKPAYCPLGADGQPVFYTNMLAECPYALSVGSTELNRPAGSQAGAYRPAFERLDEIATQAFASGGGFSNAFDAPEWQRAAISKYFASTKLTFSGYDKPVENGNFTVVKGVANRFYKHGRGYPDIAAVGDRQVVYVSGLWYRYGGTSLSAPVVASMVTLANEERLRRGKKAIGFFTPALYAHPEVLHDITVGSNPGCNTTGFPTAPGWDPVTGWGSLIYPKFAALLQSL
ncbi:peptidase S8/S53 domain-containing protein [Microdochium bolleyi]|uniref:Peptidase S8/S53 domain-containing protein n=1 Tax=Microdochium bolleyi TaxID=196109 RepID=A0A136IMN5_9PEZI|nr:peptidase S8/S53 domain-containing protein [Microdochium bolleyi]